MIELTFNFFTIFIIVLVIIIFLVVGYYLGKLITNLQWKIKFDKKVDERIERERKDAIKKSRSVLTGQFSEQIAPYLPDFKYSPTEVRFIGKPIDFIVFKGMDEKDIDEVIFVEVKSGKSQLSSHERKLRDAIKSKRVKWEEYRVKG